MQRSGFVLALSAMASASWACGCSQAALRQTATAVFFSGHVLLPDEPARMKAPYGIRPLRVQGPISWVVPIADGVVLVDTGVDENARLLREQLAATPLRAIFLTHGHIDHAAGAARFGDAPVYIGADDVPLIRGQRVYVADFLRAVDGTIGHPAAPERLIGVADNAVIEIGGARFRAVAMPGHTPGSTAWLYRDVLFTGDAAVSIHGGRLQAAYPIVTEDYAQAKTSLRRLRQIEYRFVCDSHFGCVERGARAIDSAIGW